MKRLIVNADDLGADEGRNTGIFEAINAGAVTSVSMLPNGPALAHAVSGIHSFAGQDLSMGIHFNLSEGEPISPGLKLLTGREGRFQGKKKAQRLLANRGNPELEDEIRKELGAQIAALRNTGIRLDHLDGHQHVHVFPAVARVAAEEAKENGIPWIRVPEETAAEYLARPLSRVLLEEAELFSNYAEAARPLFHAVGICTTNYFRGLRFKGNLPADSWLEFFEAIPHGITELMVHPGIPGLSAPSPFSAFSNPDREAELRALTDGRFRRALLNAGVELIPFPEELI